MLSADEIVGKLDAGKLRLEKVLADSWDKLGHAQAAGGGGFYTPVMANISSDGAPWARTIVLRHATPAGRKLAFFTDARSAKAGQIETGSPLCVVFYDRELALQLRAFGAAKVHHRDDEARRAWQSARPSSRRYYRVDPGPDGLLKAPASGLSEADYEAGMSEEALEPGFENFMLIRMQVDRLDWLFLGMEGNRAARFEWDGRGDLSATWRVP
ncbi:MAG: pyridoxamine 5'-phosphate oxidase family protein [Alphaproteobacteria bacterium]|nr:pyridoxamine 5'-phosphate oxidase family protein [Alphaproteobacteria bacterium]